MQCFQYVTNKNSLGDLKRPNIANLLSDLILQRLKKNI